MFLMGLSLVTYPIVSQVVYYRASHAKINEFKEEAQKIDRTEINRRLDLARAYNETVQWRASGDPFTEKQKEGRKEYARMLEVEEQIGYISIPSIHVELPIYAGTSEDILQRGAGHLEGTSLPVGGTTTHAVITAHRGLPNARLFTDLNHVKKGDVFYVNNIGETLAYQVDQIQVVEPSDIDAVKLVEGQDYVTLLTCTPYMINSHRLLVRGHRIPYVEKQEKAIRKESVGFLYKRVLLVLLIVFLLIALIVYYQYRKKKQKI
ncbi:class C sortase [Atopobacter phocae]|uniref:class C sortase n=1 Tax=Atopobacter phocae TaxID=136492 RepID=UPI0006847602|nr:class C sortase [Atopobacter phocae]